jgi:hypothetical protein
MVVVPSVARNILSVARGQSWWRHARSLLALLVGTTTACDFGKIDVPPTQSQLVIQAVLNASAASQVVLVERMHTGIVAVHDTLPFNAADPIFSDHGLPVSSAKVDLVSPSGDVTRAVEDKVDNRGTGMYRIALGGNRLVPGGRYELHIHTLEGEDASAETTLPNARPVAGGTIEQTFDRDRDTLAATWAAVPGARSYSVRVESPFGPFFLFSDSTRFRLTGQLRNLFSAVGLPRVLVPGFRQTITVVAVDSNFYDYYRTGNDPFTGSGIISRVTGGIGFFGSVVTVYSRTLNVTQATKDSIEATYNYVPVPGDTARVFALNVRLYVESASPKEGVPASLSGSYQPLGTGARTQGLIGTLNTPRLSFALLNNQLARDTVAVFTGSLRGDSLVGSYKGRSTPAVFVRPR